MSSVQLGIEKTETHLLTHGSWNGMPELLSYGSNETGVRLLNGGEVVPGSFELIQHDWKDWKAAGEFIKKALAKGWSVDRIANVMHWIRERR